MQLHRLLHLQIPTWVRRQYIASMGLTFEGEFYVESRQLLRQMGSCPCLLSWRAQRH